MFPSASPVDAGTDGDTPEVTIGAFLKEIQESLSLMAIPAPRLKLYKEEIESLSKLYQPKVTVAICGTTGAGKSSLLNAVLDVDIVPTSSMRACTSVVTQLSWNRESEKIAADVEFLTKSEWIDELVILLSDLAESASSERVKHTNQLVGASAAAWAKIHAVYPNVSLQKMVDMDADMLMQKFPHISQLLGTSARVEASDIENFRRALEPYLDSCEHTNHQALWPLIRNVKIFCRSAVLSTGLTLVDLPGMADTNAARDKVAKDYLKDCDHCWIVSPITRAISDKVASELLGHMFRLQLKLDGKLSSGSGVTFIATKNEDIKPSEVVKNLGLEDDSEFQSLTENLMVYQQVLDRWNDGIEEIATDGKSIRKRITESINNLNEYNQALAVLRAGDGGRATPSYAHGLPQSTMKRKYSSMFSMQEQKEPRKRKRQRVQIGAGEALNPGHSETRQDDVINQAPSLGPGIGSMSIEELESSIRDTERNIQQLNNELFDISKCQENVIRGRDEAHEDLKDAEKDIRAFCAVQRAEYSRDLLKEDFRSNLDECAVEDIGQKDLPVFVVSSWDYASLQAPDKQSVCFNDVQETEIPALQDWCHELTVPARKENAKVLAIQFRAFALVLKTFLEGVGGVAERDRDNMRKKWASSPQLLVRCKENPSGEMMDAAIITPSKDRRGLTSRLLASFHAIVEDSVEDLQSRFTEYLQDDCDEGAISAAETAVDTSKEIAQMIWQKYRAFLRRDGCYEEYDLNSELTIPFVSHISQNWCRLFQSNLFDVFETSTVQGVEKLVDEVALSVPEYLTSRARKQGEVALEQTRAFLTESVTTVRRALDAHQRSISRRLAPHVQEQLEEGYQAALLITGPGSTPEQKQAVHDYLDDKKDEIFCGAADVLMSGLGAAASTIGKALEVDLTRLSTTVENTIAVLWEGPLEDDNGIRNRVALIQLLDKAIAQSEVWLIEKDDS